MNYSCNHAHIITPTVLLQMLHLIIAVVLPDHQSFIFKKAKSFGTEPAACPVVVANSFVGMDNDGSEDLFCCSLWTPSVWLMIANSQNVMPLSSICQ